jgi:hypothetical protein
MSFRKSQTRSVRQDAIEPPTDVVDQRANEIHEAHVDSKENTVQEPFLIELQKAQADLRRASDGLRKAQVEFGRCFVELQQRTLELLEAPSWRDEYLRRHLAAIDQLLGEVQKFSDESANGAPRPSVAKP